MRIIDADELIKAIDCSADMGGALGKVVDVVKLYAKFMAQTTPTIEPQNWIPCSERLPDNKGKYLTTYHPCYWDMVEDGLEIDVDTFQGKSSWAKRKHHRVIAWMPLPKAFKEGEK